MARTKAKTGDEPDRPDYVLPDRELVVVAEPSARLRAGRGEVQAAPGTETAALNALLAEEGVALEPLFGASEERTRAAGEALSGIGGAEVPDLSIYYRVRAEDERLDELALSLAKLPGIAQAYVKPAAEPAVPQLEDEVLERRTSAAADTPPVTPDFTAGQRYLVAAPGGVDARYAWTLAGWRRRRRRASSTSRAPGASPTRTSLSEPGRRRRRHADRRHGWRNHGTAVVGEFGGDATPSASPASAPTPTSGRSRSSAGSDRPSAIHRRPTLLSAGDIILHRAAPRRAAPQLPGAQRPARLHRDRVVAGRLRRDPLRHRAGVIVVEAAGNGAENLDDAHLRHARPPASRRPWTNPFNRTNRDSGAVVVGAGAPPPGTHGAGPRARPVAPRLLQLRRARRRPGLGPRGDDDGVRRSAGRRATSGSGTRTTFSGTSSASPIVVGVLRAASRACSEGRRAGSADAGRRRSQRAPRRPARRSRTPRAGPRPSGSAGARTSGRPWRA